MLITIITLTTALAVGWIVNARLRARANTETLVVGLDAMVSPLLTLTTLLLAFVMVQVFSSHNRAKLSAGEEAGQVVAEFRLFHYLNDDHSALGQATMLCYARAVTNLEWPVMAEAGLVMVPEVTHWGMGVDVILTDIAATSTSRVFGSLLATDKERTEARRRRVAETRPAVPKPVTWLMLAVSAVAILSMTSLAQPSLRGPVKIGALTMLTLVFAIMQLAILDIDSKYDGWIRVDPDEMKFISGILQQQFEIKYPQYPIPCDASGVQLTVD